MEKFLILASLAVLAFFAGRYFDRLRRRPAGRHFSVLLTLLALAMSLGLVIHGFLKGWTNSTILLAALWLFILAGRLHLIRRQQASK